MKAVSWQATGVTDHWPSVRWTDEWLSQVIRVKSDETSAFIDSIRVLDGDPMGLGLNRKLFPASTGSPFLLANPY